MGTQIGLGWGRQNERDGVMVEDPSLSRVRSATSLWAALYILSLIILLTVCVRKYQPLFLVLSSSPQGSTLFEDRKGALVTMLLLTPSHINSQNYSYSIEFILDQATVSPEMG